MQDDLDTLPIVRRSAVLPFVVGLLAGVALSFVFFSPDNRPAESLRKENELLREMNRLLEEERAKVRKALEEGAE